MYPVLFTIPGSGAEVSSFGVMMMLGFIAAHWLTVREMPHKGIDPKYGISLLVLIMVGGVLGSKLYYAIDMSFREGLSWNVYFFRRAGITWYGGLIGGIAAGALGCRLYGIALRRLLEASAVAVAVGQSLGRIGCFLAGDDYGIASSLPWAVAFPLGSPPVYFPVHPTQLYEVAWLIPVAFFLHHRRNDSPFLFGEYLIANGVGRFFIEWLRVNPRVALGLTEPQWLGIALVIVGIASLLYFRRVKFAASAA